MIYFAQNPDGGPIKIGYSRNVERRRRELVAKYGRPLVVLATMPGGRDQEMAIHERFAHLRLKSNRRGRVLEQFKPTAELMEFISCSFALELDPDSVEAMKGPTQVVGTVRLDLSLEIHQMLRVVAAEQGKSMAVFARDIVREAVHRYSGKGKPC